MNTLIKQTVDKISNHIELNDSEKMCIAVEIGDVIMKVLTDSKNKPNFNLKGGKNVDNSTLGNF